MAADVRLDRPRFIRVRFEKSGIRKIQFQQLQKFQITNHKYQANRNYRNSKFETIGVRSYLKFGYCDLEFICDLLLVICYFRFIRV
jgi:hypothetical protein